MFSENNYILLIKLVANRDLTTITGKLKDNSIFGSTLSISTSSRIRNIVNVKNN